MQMQHLRNWRASILDKSTDNKSNIFVPTRKKLKGEIFLEEYYGKPLEDIGTISDNNPEINWGKPVGEEIW